MRVSAALLLLWLTGGAAAQSAWSGFIAAEAWGFAHAPLAPVQERHTGALAFQPEYYRSWAGGDQRLVFTGFVRLDWQDARRTHADIRELYWERVGATWEIRVGLRKLFWGVTESQHLVDILNQTDQVERPDGEAKLGQPVVEWALVRDWGTLHLLALPGFRQRLFPGVKGRLRAIPRVDPERTVYASDAEERHVDWAVRWSHYWGDFDFGLAHFYGTSRDPVFFPARDHNGRIVVAARYDLIHQTSLDMQATRGAWLWKLEAFTRRGQGDRFIALTGGFEYTFGDLRRSGADLGLLAEYLYDERGTGSTPFNDDVFIGARLALNDIQDTQVLAGAIIDRSSHARLVRLEGARRLGDAVKLEVELLGFAGAKPNDPLYWWRRDDHIRLILARYF